MVLQPFWLSAAESPNKPNLILKRKRDLATIEWVLRKASFWTTRQNRDPISLPFKLVRRDWNASERGSLMKLLPINLKPFAPKL
jgi:hypothetical protein